MDALTDFQLGLIVIGIALLIAGLVFWALMRLIRRLLPAPARRKTRVARARREFDWLEDEYLIINPSTGSLMPPGGIDASGHLYGEPVDANPFNRYDQ